MKVCIYGAGAIGGWIGAHLARQGCDLSAVARGATLEALPTSHSTPEINVACAEGEPHALVERLVALAAKLPQFDPPAERCTLDGLRVDWPDGFGLIRASNTTPVLVLRFEGQTPEALTRIEGEMLALLRRVKPDAVLGASAH